MTSNTGRRAGTQGLQTAGTGYAQYSDGRKLGRLRVHRIELNGDDLRRDPLERRKAKLEEIELRARELALFLAF